MYDPAIVPGLMGADAGLLLDDRHRRAREQLEKAPGYCQTDDAAADDNERLGLQRLARRSHGHSQHFINAGVAQHDQPAPARISYEFSCHIYSS